MKNIKKKFLSLFMVGTMFVVSGCSGEESRTMKDRSGSEIANIPTNIEKIISTAPSNTEIIADLGLADKLVAIDTYSTDIEGINEDLTKIDFAAPDAEVIVGLEPDIIIASGHNQTGSAQDPFKAVSDAGIPVVYIPSSDSIEGIYKDIEFIADVLNVKEEGTKLVDETKAKIEEIASRNAKNEKKKVYFEIGPAPDLFSFGNTTFLNEMIELVGGSNIFKDQESWISPSEEAVLDENPDVILTNVNYIENAVDEIKTRQGWENINAVKNNDVYLIDTNSSSRPSHNIIKALEEMEKAINNK